MQASCQELAGLLNICMPTMYPWLWQLAPWEKALRSNSPGKLPASCGPCSRWPIGKIENVPPQYVIRLQDRSKQDTKVILWATVHASCCKMSRRLLSQIMHLLFLFYVKIWCLLGIKFDWLAGRSLWWWGRGGQACSRMLQEGGTAVGILCSRVSCRWRCPCRSATLRKHTTTSLAGFYTHWHN